MRNNQAKSDRYAAIQGLLTWCLLIIALLFLVVKGFSQENLQNFSKTVLTEDILPVENSDSSLFANMSIAVDGGISLSYAYLIVNNIPVDDFSRGSVLLRVYPGDRIAVDASAYRRELTFCIEAVSVNVDRSVLNDKITANGDLIEIGTIRFR